MARSTFGGTHADLVLTGSVFLKRGNATLTFWDAPTGGTRYTDLLLNGSPVSSITSVDGQVPAFEGPDDGGVEANRVRKMWADDGDATRHLMIDRAKGEKGDVGPGASDPEVAAYIDDTTSTTRASLNATFVPGGLQPVNVKSPAYGAVGDGVADDTAAIAAAVADAAGRAVYLPAGTYLVTSKIDITTSGTRLHLDNARIKAGANVIPFAFTGTSGVPLVDVGVRGGTIDLASTAAIGVQFIYCNDPHAEGIRILDSFDKSGAGVSFKNCQRPRVSQVSGSNVGIGVALDASPGGSVVGGTFTDMRLDAVLAFSGSDDTAITGVTIKGYNTTGESGRAGIHAYGSERVTVNGCAVDSGSVGGTGDSPKIRFRDVDGFVCSGNHVTGPKGGGIVAIALSDQATLTGKGSITGNTVRDVAAQGIAVTIGSGGVSTDVHPVTIAGNNIVGVRVSGGSTGDGITVPHGGAVVISSNYIEDIDGTGIYTPLASSSIIGNVIRNVGKSVASSGIFVAGGTATVVGNFVRDDQGTPTTNHGLRVLAGATARVAGNLYIGTSAAAVRNDGTIEAQVGEIASAKVGFFGATPVVKPTALTAADGATVDATYGTEESGVINNLRTRLGELETKLRTLGLLT